MTAKLFNFEDLKKIVANDVVARNKVLDQLTEETERLGLYEDKKSDGKDD